MMWEIIEISLFCEIIFFTSISIHFRLCITSQYLSEASQKTISPVTLLLTSYSCASSSKLSNVISCLKKKMLKGVSLLSLKVLTKMLGFFLKVSV